MKLVKIHNIDCIKSGLIGSSKNSILSPMPEYNCTNSNLIISNGDLKSFKDNTEFFTQAAKHKLYSKIFFLDGAIEQINNLEFFNAYQNLILNNEVELFLVGEMDSISAMLYSSIKKNEENILFESYKAYLEDLKKDKPLGLNKKIKIIYKDNQNYNDLHFALDIIRKLNQNYKFSSKVDIIGAFGGRLDHSLANIMELKNFRGLDMQLFNNQNIVKLLDSDSELGQNSLNSESKLYEFELCNECYANNSQIGLVALSEIEALSLDGFKFNLKSENIKIGQNLSSNHINCIATPTQHATLSFIKGKLLLIKTFE